MDVALSSLELKDDTVIVVLGASGDLAKKKTVRCSRTGDSRQVFKLTF
jgi:glucose-6-phosphate 1-dehydrogenase